MKQMAKFMVVHRDPNIPWAKVEESWGKLAKIETAKWLRTYYNKEEGVRYCLWLAPSSEEMANIFTDLNVSYESIVAVEETVPDLWGKGWEEHLAEEEKADTLAF